jgi:hypothetical protein
VTGLIAAIDATRKVGLPGKFWWALSAQAFTFATGVPGAKVPFACRFEPWRDMTIAGISIKVTTKSATNDSVAAFMLAADGKTQLAASGAVAGKVNGSVARQDIDFAKAVKLEAGQIYYPTFQYGESAAPASLARLEAGQTADLFGAAKPDRLMVQSAATTFPMAGETEIGATGSASYCLLVREA